MPRAKKPAAAPVASKAPKMDNIEVSDDECEDSPVSSCIDEVEEESRDKKKRVAAVATASEGEEGNFFAGEMQKMLECFGSDMSKTLSAKRRKLEQFTHVSTKNSSKKVEEIWKSNLNDRQKLVEEFDRQMKGFFQQWDTDLRKSKEQEDKLQQLFQQQQKLFQQTRIIQSQRLKTVKQLFEQYKTGMDDLEKSHSEQQSMVHSELKKEMSMLQKKILMDVQHQEISNVKKSLQTMLF